MNERAILHDAATAVVPSRARFGAFAAVREFLTSVRVCVCVCVRAANVR